MNRSKYILLLGLILVILLFPTRLMAKGKASAHDRTQVYSHIGAYAGAGYSSLLHTIPNTNVLGGGFGTIGVRYQMSTIKQRFTFSVGLETMFLNSTSTLGDFDIHGLYDYKDPMGNSTQMDYQLAFSQYREQHHQWSIDMPILFGKDFKYSYFSLGVNLRYTLWGGYNTNTLLSISATDPELIDKLENIPTHNISSQLVDSHGKIAYGLDIMGMAEVGITLDRLIMHFNRDLEFRSSRIPKNISYRLGVFAAFGALSINANTCDKALVNFDNAKQNGNNIVVPEKDLFHIANASIFTTPSAADKAVNALTVGVKFIVLLQLNQICRTCTY